MQIANEKHLFGSTAINIFQIVIHNPIFLLGQTRFPVKSTKFALRILIPAVSIVYGVTICFAVYF